MAYDARVRKARSSDTAGIAKVQVTAWKAAYRGLLPDDTGFVLAVCSCTILPLFAGIYRQGAGLGPAINILAVSYTGVAIGLDIAVARIILSAVCGIGDLASS